MKTIGWPVVPLLMVTQTIGWGTSLSFLGVLALPVGQDLEMPVSIAYAGASLFYGVGAFTAAVTGRLCDRFGSFAVLAAGSLSFMLALLTLATAQNWLQYFLSWCIFGAGMNAALATASYSALVQTDFGNANRNIASLTLATGLSSSLFWPISSFLISEIGWRNTCLAYAVVTLAIPFAVHLILMYRASHARADMTQATWEGGQDPGALHSGRRALGFLKVAMVCAGFYTSAMALMIIGLFVKLGTDYALALTAASFLGVSYIAGRLIYMAVVRRVGMIVLAIGTFVLLPVAILPLLAWSFTGMPLPFTVALATTITYGIASGIITVLRPALLLALVGRQAYGREMGLFSGPLNLVSAVAPVTFGLLLDLSSSAFLMVGAAVSVAAAFMIVGMARSFANGFPPDAGS